MPAVQRIQRNLSKNMLLYCILSIVAGLVTGYYFKAKWACSLITPTVFFMVYPMMVNLSLESLKKVRTVLKPLAEALILNFLVAPALFYGLSEIFSAPPRMEAALLLLSVAPASSMGLGYVGLAGGDMLAAVTIVASAFLLSLVAYPLMGYYVARGAQIHVPTQLFLRSLVMVLVLPLVLGVATREYIERRGGPGKFKEVKPYFSLATLTGLYILLYFIFACKARLVVSHYRDLAVLTPLALIYYGVVISLLLVINSRLLRLSYEQHQAVVFTSVSKNVALTIAVLATAFGETGKFMAVYPAIISIIQAITLVSYIKLSEGVRGLFQASQSTG
ncbi:arsenic resistance protein [Stetteria hydrogenophila]